MRRINGKVKSLYRNEWQVAFYEDEYGTTTPSVTTHRIHVGPRRILVHNINTGDTTKYQSYREFEYKNGLKRKSVAVKTTYKKGDTFIFHDKYKITLLN